MTGFGRDCEFALGPVFGQQAGTTFRRFYDDTSAFCPVAVLPKEFNAVNRIFSILSVIVLLFCGNVSRASDGFSAVRCGSDISKALIGRTMSNERVVVVEARHKNLGLEDLGGSDISERLFLISWRICGDEYALLEEKDVVRDVLKFPPHSKDSPEFIGSCQINGNEMPDTIIAVLENRRGAEALPAKAAWKIDVAGTRFVKLPTEGLLCPRDGVITTDGGH